MFLNLTEYNGGIPAQQNRDASHYVLLDLTLTSVPQVAARFYAYMEIVAIEYSALVEPGVRRMRATIPVVRSQSSGQ